MICHSVTSLNSRFKAPLALMSPTNDDDDRNVQLPSDHPHRDVRSLRVLLVEDEFFISMATEAMLEDLGHVVVGTAVSASEAVQLAEQQRPDVVLMDIRLVGPTDGIDAAKEIYISLGLRSIFVTANTDAHTRQRARGANPLGFIEKPLTDDRLKGALNLVP